MKLILSILLLFFSTLIYSQILKVCPNSWQRFAYESNDSINTTFFWILDKNIINSKTYNNGDSIDILWGSTFGLYKIGAFEVNEFDCSSDTVWQYVQINYIDKVDNNLTYCKDDIININLNDNYNNVIWNDTLLSNTYKTIALNSDTIKFKSIFNKCEYDDSIYVKVNSLPTSNIIINNVSVDSIQLCSDVILENKTDELYYTWHYNNITDYNNQLKLNKIQNYNEIYLTTKNEYNCKSTDSVKVIACDITNNLPIAFTPNGDGFNDYWDISKLAYYNFYELSIYNRWGMLEFYSVNPTKWDGRDGNGKTLPMDCYYYIIYIHDTKKSIIGNITIIR